MSPDVTAHRPAAAREGVLSSSVLVHFKNVTALETLFAIQRTEMTEKYRPQAV